MSCRMFTKSTTPMKKVYRASIKSLPKDLLVELFVRVGSNSVEDLHNVKLSCKDFCEAVDSDYIYKFASMEKLPIALWRTSKGAASFFERCKSNGNAEAFYRLGIFEYFGCGGNQESGLENLKKAVVKGHKEAMYLYGIILLCAGDQSKEEGMELLCGMENQESFKGLGLAAQREKIKASLCQIWRNNNKLIPKEKIGCNMLTCMDSRTVNSWPLIAEEEDRIACKFCRWEYQVKEFSHT